MNNTTITSTRNLQQQCGLVPMWAVGFTSKTHRTFVYQVFTQEHVNSQVDKINAAYDGECLRPKAITASMILRGRGLSRIPVYALCRDVQDAERYADDLMLVVQRKTTNNIKVLARDTSTITKKVWKDLTKGLWSVSVPEWR